MQSLEDRRTDSRKRIRSTLDIAFGLYIGEEPKKGDSWRDTEYGKLYSHLSHEVEEIRRSKTKERRLHNCLDACMLSAILASKIIIEEEKK